MNKLCPQILLLVFLLLLACCVSAQYDDQVPDKLQMMQLYSSKLKEQLGTLRITKQNLIALRDAHEIISPFVDNFNIDRDQLKGMMDRVNVDLINLVQQERDLAIKANIISSSISVLTERQVISDLFTYQSTSKPIPGSNCICFDATTGKSCKTEDLPTDMYTIVESVMLDGTIVKNLSSIQNYIPKTCREYLTNFYVGKTGNGFYLVKPSIELPEFPVYCDMSKGGWIYLNGLLSLEAPFKQPVSPITPDLVESVEYKSLIKLANQVKSMVGDECTIAYQAQDYHEQVMKKLCTIDGFSSSGKFISFFQYFIR